MDLRNEAAFRDIKDLDGLARGYFNAQKLIGARPEDVIRIPTGADDKPAWDAVHARLGRPEKPDGYQFTAPKLPEGVKLDETLQSGFATKAHEIGLNARQAAALFDWYNGETANRFSAGQTQTARAEETAVNGLKTEWAAAFDHNVELAKGALAHFGGEKLATELAATRLGNHPELIKAFAKIGATLAEDGLIGRGGASGDGPLSPAEARQQIGALRGDGDFSKAYLDAKHPGHKDAIAKMERLHQFAFPDTTGA